MIAKVDYDFPWIIRHMLDVALLKTGKRISRGEFFLAPLFYLLFFVVGLAMSFFVSISFGIIMAYFASFLRLVLNIVLSIRRLRDIDVNPGLVLLTFVPFINMVMGVVLLFMEGTPGKNTYGPDPLLHQPKTDGLYWLLFLVLSATIVLLILGILRLFYAMPEHFEHLFDAM